MLTKKAGSLREQVILAAKTLFMTYGYEAVGMRDIANAVGKQPVQVYRLDLSKSDILAEVIIALNTEQIAELPKLYSQITGTTLFDRICSYLKQLYSLDIEYLPIRSVGAAFGWMWSKEHECRVIEQVGQLVKPVADWMLDAGLDDIPARCIGIWSLYYVGYRQAVIHCGNADDCLNAIKPSLRFFLVSPEISNEDLIARRQIEEVTRLSEARLNRAELVSKTGNWELHLDAQFIFASLGAAKIYGLTNDKFDLTAIQQMALPEYRPKLDASLNNLLLHDTPYDLEYQIRTADTHEIKDIYSQAIFDRERRILFGVIQDITEQKKIEKELERLAQTDPLTGLANRRHFMQLADNELLRSQRYGGELSILMIDIDHFKKINDTYGHHVGDLVIQSLSDTCRNTLREIDIIGRIGGEEFAVVLPQTAGQPALEVAERLRKAIANTAFSPEPDVSIHFTVSIGVTTLTSNKQNDIETQLRFADKALYDAKLDGRNKVCFV